MTWPTFFWLLFNRLDGLLGLVLAAVVALVDPLHYRADMPKPSGSVVGLIACAVLVVSAVLLLSRLIRLLRS